MKRLVSIDVGRGLAIMGVVFFHAVIFNLPLSSPTPTDASTKLVLDIITYFTAWAGMFAIISGFGNTLSLYGGLKSGKVKDPKQAVQSAVFSGGMIIIVNYICVFIFCPGGFTDAGTYRGGFLPGLIREGQFLIAETAHYMFATTLIMIGWSILLSGVVLYFLLRNDGHKKRKRNYILLGFLGTFFIFIYPLFDGLTYSLLHQDTNLLNFIPQLVLGWIVGPMDPIFPYFGFALYGVILGFMFVEKVEKRKILRFGFGLGAIYTILGIVFVLIFGYEVIKWETPNLAALLLMLGPMFLLLMFILYRIDLRGEEKKVAWVERSTAVRRFGTVGLTIFILEGTLVQLMRHVFRLFLPGFDDYLIFMFFAFTTVNVIIWAIILKYWEKVDYKYSFEWFMIKLRCRITKKDSDRLSAYKSLDSYVEQETTR